MRKGKPNRFDLGAHHQGHAATTAHSLQVGFLVRRQPAGRGFTLNLEVATIQQDPADVAQARFARVDKPMTKLDPSAALPPAQKANVLQNVKDSGLDLGFCHSVTTSVIPCSFRDSQNEQPILGFLIGMSSPSSRVYDPLINT